MKTNDMLRERQRDRQRDRPGDRRRDRQTDTPTDIRTDRQTDTQAGREIDRETDRETDRQRERERERESDDKSFLYKWEVENFVFSLIELQRPELKSRNSLDSQLTRMTRRQALEKNRKVESTTGIRSVLWG